MSLTRSLWRASLLAAMLLAATLDLWLRRPRVGAEGATWIHKWCRRLVAAMGLEYKVEGTLPRSGAVVSNHLSYLDILLYSATTPFVMVAKSEVKRWPLIGRLTARAGTVYVDRGGGPSTYDAVNLAMSAAYRSGLPVLFFPEGTTTDGSGVLPFRRGLFHSVLNNRVPLRTAAVRYSIGSGNGAATVADHVCWWGDAFFAPHIFNFLGLNGVEASIRFTDAPVEGSDRFQLSERAQAQVCHSYKELEREPGRSSVQACELAMVSSSL